MKTTIINLSNRLVNSNDTLKSVKADAIEELAVNVHAEEQINLCRTKKALNQYLQELLKELKDDPIQVLQDNANNINDHLANAMNSHMAIGQILTESRELFSSMKEFLVWAKNACGLQKAQVYNLMKVWKVFGQDATFQYVSMRVLSNLSRCSEEVIAQASEHIKKHGKLNTKGLNKIIDLVEKVEEEKPEPKQSEQPGNADNSDNSDDTGNNEQPKDANEQANASRRTTDTTIEGDEDTQEPSESERLQAKIIQLEKQLEDTKKNLEKVLKSNKVVELPQFSNNCMYARLGLSLEQSKDKKQVNAVYRTLASVYNSTEYPVISKSLLEAREALNK